MIEDKLEALNDEFDELYEENDRLRFLVAAAHNVIIDNLATKHRKTIWALHIHSSQSTEPERIAENTRYGHGAEELLSKFENKTLTYTEEERQNFRRSLAKEKSRIVEATRAEGLRQRRLEAKNEFLNWRFPT